MFGLGTGEIMIILVLALILLGPARLPEAAKQIGKGLRTITRATEDVKRQVQTAMYEDERIKPPLPQPPVGPPAGGHPSGTAAGDAASSRGEALVASAANVPGLDAALAEPAPTPAAPRAAPAPEPAVTDPAVTEPAVTDGSPKA